MKGAQGEYGSSGADTERETPEDVREPMLAHIHAIRGGHKRPSQTKRGGLAGS